MDVEDRVRKIEYAVWGLRGDNGLVSEVRALRLDLQRRFAEEAERRTEEAHEKKLDRRWRIGTTIAIIGAILIAAGIVAQAL